jgi:chaperone BCS1
MFISIFLYVIFLAFKTLANSYLELKDHKFFSQVVDIFQSGASLSSAEISELMIANQNSLSQAKKLVITTLQMDDDRRGVGKIGSQLGNYATPNIHIFKIYIYEIKF